MAEITSEQQFRIEMTKQVTTISTQLQSLVESNKRQDELFDEHRSNIRAALSEHAESVDAKLDKITEEQKKLRSFVDKVVGVGTLLLFLVPTALTFVEVNHLITNNDVNTASVSSQIHRLP